MRTAAVLVLLLWCGLPPAQAEDPAPFEGRFDFKLRRPKWQPVNCYGRLSLRRTGDAWNGTIRFRVLMNGATLTLDDIAVEEGRLRFHVPKLDYTVTAQPTDGGLSGTCEAKGGETFDWMARRVETIPVPLFEDGLRFGGVFPKGDAKSLGLDMEALFDLVGQASRADTDALLILKDGKIVCERTFGRKGGAMPTMSVTKFVTALVFGHLLEKGKIKSIDQPVSDWYPDWKEGTKGRVTLRHLLTHTSGIRHDRNASRLNAEDDRVAWVLGHDVEAPGTSWSYNNDAVALLSGIFAKAAGRPVDEYARKRLFAPLGIKDVRWNRDASGNTVTYAELWLDARGLARIGRVVVDRGKPILKAKTVALLEAQGSSLAPYQGLLWFRILEDGKAIGVRHDGWRGQHLVVFPEKGLVGVRLRRGWKTEDLPEYQMASFPGLVSSLLR